MQEPRGAARTNSQAVTHAKAKFDDQIVAIAAVEGAGKMYSDDPHIKKRAGGRFEVIGIGDLPLPPESAQGSLPRDLEADEADTDTDENGAE